MSDFAAPKTYALFNNPESRKIVGELEKNGADFKLFPAIEIEKLTLDEQQIEILRNLKEFDWLIFQDVLAVDYFLENLEANEIDFYELDYLRICAGGETVADRLRFSAIHSDVIPKTTDSNQVLAEIVGYVGEAEIGKLKILIPKINSADELTLKLKELAAEVCELPIYGAKDFLNFDATKLKILLKGGAIDEFIFTSAVDFVALKHLFKNVKIADVFGGIRVSAADSFILQTLREQNLPLAGLFNLSKLDKVKR
jgi:uroporphyrinogen-III synthase